MYFFCKLMQKAINGHQNKHSSLVRHHLKLITSLQLVIQLTSKNEQCDYRSFQNTNSFSVKFKYKYFYVHGFSMFYFIAVHASIFHISGAYIRLLGVINRLARNGICTVCLVRKPFKSIGFVDSTRESADCPSTKYYCLNSGFRNGTVL